MLNVIIVSPEKTLYSAQTDCVTVPGEKGRFEVLTGHAPIVSILSNGIITCGSDSNYSLYIKGGFIEVNNDNVSICVEEQ